jgi:RHS repeat-associated protein
VTTAAGTESYVYDALNRLTSVTYPNSDTEGFTYDANGNRLTYGLNGQTLNTYTYDDADQLTSDGVVSYSHDLAGNLLQAGTDSYTWDWNNRLTGSTVGGTTASYSYDGDDVRVSQTVGGTTSWYVYDRLSGLPLLIDDGTSGYVHAGGVLAQLDGQGNTDWLLDDALGSVRGVADGAGTLTGTADFAASGAVRSQSGTASLFGFTGEQTDAATGNVYLRARYHNPATGRFLSADTVQPNAPGTQGYNRYSYTANNPATWTDPSGHTAGSLQQGAIDLQSSVYLFGQALAAHAIQTAGQFEKLRNGLGPRIPRLTGTEFAPILGMMRNILQVFKAAFAGTMLIHVGGSIVGRAIGAALAVLAWTLLGVLFFLLGQLFVTLAPWNHYPDVMAPTRVMDWTVKEVRTAVLTYPLFPGHQPCTVSGVTTEVAQGILWSMMLNGSLFAYSTTDMLLDIGMACFVGNSGGSSNLLPPLDPSRIVIPGPRNSPLGKTDYLLGRVDHPDSISKGDVFGRQMGFSDESLAQALRRHLIANYDRAAKVRGGHSAGEIQFEVTGPMTGPNGATFNITSAWVLRSDGNFELVTAHPAR